MRDEQRWMLAILQEVARQHVMLTGEFYAVLNAVFHLSDAETNEIAEILKAELIETLARSKHEELRDMRGGWLSRMGPLNP